MVPRLGLGSRVFGLRVTDPFPRSPLEGLAGVVRCRAVSTSAESEIPTAELR